MSKIQCGGFNFDDSAFKMKSVNGKKVLSVGSDVVALGEVNNKIIETGSLIVTINGIACSDNKAVLFQSSNIIFSEDCLHWIVVSKIPANFLGNVAYGNGMFVAVSPGNLYANAMYSKDGIHWNESVLPSSFKRGYAIAYGNGKFVTVRNSSNLAFYSEDGVNWQEVTLPVSGNWFFMAYGSEKFVLVGRSDVYLYSEDGINWVQGTLPASDPSALIYGNDKFIFTVDGSETGFYSNDGITWTEMTMPNSRSWNKLVYGNGKFVAVSTNKNNGHYTACSEDGITWTEYVIPTPISSYYYTKLFYVNNQFVLIDISGFAALSKDGITWDYTRPAFVNLANGEDITNEVRDILDIQNNFNTLPSVTAGDAGKVLVVNENGTGYELKVLS